MTRDPMVDDLATWAAKTSRELHGDLDEAERLVELLGDHIGVDLDDLRPRHLEQLLLQVYPRKVTVLDRDDLSDVMPTVRELVAFLGDSGRIPAARVKELEVAADRIEPQFPDAVMDRSRWGMARTFTQAMAEDGVDFSDEAAVNRWIDRYNASLPAGGPGDPDRVVDSAFDDGADGIDIKEAFGLPDRLPPLRLPSEAELADIARASALLDRASRLASWLSERPRALADHELTAADTVAAARALGLDVELHEPAADTLPDMPGRPAVRRMDDVPDLVRVWELADELDFIDVDDRRATGGPGVAEWPDGTDEDVLEIWQHALADTLDRPLLIADERLPSSELEFTGAGPTVLVALYLSGGEGIPVTDVREMLKETTTGDLPSATVETAWRSWVDTCGDAVEVLLAPLAALGAVDVQHETVRLTSLSLYAVRLQMLDAEVDVPLLPAAEDMTAADLVQVGAYGTATELATESAAWLGRHSAEDAVDELLTVAAASGPAERVAATSIATGVGAEGQDRWRQALDEPVLRPYAKLALVQFGGAEPGETMADLEPTMTDLAWLVTETIAGTTDLLDEDELVEELGNTVPPGKEQQLFEHMWRLDHPCAHQVLLTIGTHHPDKKVAKAARKAAYKIQPPAKRR